MTLTDRPMTVTSALGPDAMAPIRFRYASELNRPFQLTVDVLAGANDIEPKDLLGTPFTVNYPLPESVEEGSGHLSGIVTHMSFRGRVAELGDEERLKEQWRLEVRPTIWLLGRGRNSRVFHNKSTLDIIKAVCAEVGYADVEDDFGSWRTREVCSQYQESNLDFLHRLIEEEGARYMFDQDEEGKHVLRFTKDEQPGSKPVNMVTHGHADTGDEDTLRFLDLTHAVSVGKSAVQEYDFLSPTADGSGADEEQRSHAGDDLEFYDYVGPAHGDRAATDIATVRKQEQQSSYEVASGGGTVRFLRAGDVADVTGHQRSDMDKSYLVVRSTLDGSAGSDASGGSKMEFDCKLDMVPADSKWRPARVTAWPRIVGAQTAIVVGDEVPMSDPDGFGRVHLRFHWDREPSGPGGGSTGLVRVSQAWAGDGWGAMHNLHADHEVVVEFLDGNPDRPIITGRVHNGSNPVQPELQDQFVSGLRDIANNHLLMDATDGAEKIELRDKYGNELIMDSAEGIITMRSPTHESQMILGRSVEIKSLSDLRQLFDGNSTTDVKGNSQETVAGSSDKKIIGPFKMKVGGDLFDVTVGAFAATKLATETTIKAGNSNTVSKSRDLSITHGKTTALYKNVVEVDHTDKVLKVRGTQDEFIKRHKLEGEEKEERIKKIETSCDEIKAKIKQRREKVDKWVTDVKEELSKRKKAILKVAGEWKLSADNAITDAKKAIINKVMEIKK